MSKEQSMEEYVVEETELLTLELLQTKVESAAMAFQLAKERLAAAQQAIAGKYSEYGKYKLVGEVDRTTRTGQRTLAE